MSKPTLLSTLPPNSAYFPELFLLLFLPCPWGPARSVSGWCLNSIQPQAVPVRCSAHRVPSIFWTCFRSTSHP